MKIIESFMKYNPCYKQGHNTVIKGLMLHSVGCPQPKAQVFIDSWNRASFGSACVHAFIDGNTGDIHQTLPWNYRGWHCGSGKKGCGNDTHIGVEMCEPACIKYTSGSSFTCSDLEAARTVAKRTYHSAVELFAYLCKEFHLNPQTDIISHKEGYKKGIATNHGDPEHLWSGLGLNFTMDGFRKDVKKAMTGATETGTSDHTKIYRVQVGAYKVKANAEALMKKLKAAGFDTLMVYADGLYKVQVGAYSIKANAEKMLAKVKKAGFDTFITEEGGQAVPSVVRKSVVEVAEEVIEGKWGNGVERVQRLLAAGYDAEAVQKQVNNML